MGSDMTNRTERNNMRLLETKIVNANGKKPLTFMSHYEGDKWDQSISPHSERLSSRCEDPRSFPHELYTNKKPAKAILANQIKSIGGGETHSGEFALPNSRYIVLNNRVYEDARSTSHLDTFSPSTDVGSTRALAGLIFMCNDRVRRSFLKYSVLGAPLGKKHILDRVNASTKLFLFEFEARALWGIYEATSEASIDIEKDAYLGSETSFPAQVKVRVYKQCRPLPERLFQLAIEDNYFTPTKFSFELTEKQVSNLTKLYNMREPEKFGRTISAAETSILCETSGAQDESLYEGVRMNGRATLDAQKNNAERLRTSYRLDKLSQAREGLVRGNDSIQAKNCMGGRYLGNAEYDALKHFSLYHKDNPLSKTHKDYPISKKQEFEGTDMMNGGRASRPGLHADAITPLVDPRTTTLRCYPHEEEDILLEDDLRHQLCQSKLPHHADDPTYEPNAQALNAYFRSPVNLSDAELDSTTSFERSLSEEYYLSKLKAKQLNDSIRIRRLPLRSPNDNLRSEAASVYQRFGKGPHSYDEALWDLQSESPQIFKPCSTPLNSMQSLRTCLATPQLHAWQMHDILQGTGNGYVTQGRSRSFTNQRTLTMPSEAWTESSDHRIDGIVARDKVGACSKTVAVLDDEVRCGNLCREQFSSRSKNLQDQVENTTCFENYYTARSNCTGTDDAGWVGSIPCAVDISVAQSDKVEDDEEWLESASRDAMNSFTSTNWENAEDIFEEDLVHVENQVSKSLSGISKKRFTVAVEEDDMRPRRSVWSRLSTSSNAFKSWQVSNEPVLPENDVGELQLASGSLPWKQRPISTLTCETDPTVYEVGEEVSIEEECSGFERNEVNVDFKRRKGTLNRVISVGKPDDTNEQMGTAERKALREHGDDQRKRRKIRRPL